MESDAVAEIGEERGAEDRCRYPRAVESEGEIGNDVGHDPSRGHHDECEWDLVSADAAVYGDVDPD